MYRNKQDKKQVENHIKRLKNNKRNRRKNKKIIEKPENVQVEKVQLKNGKTKVKKTINW